MDVNETEKEKAEKNLFELREKLKEEVRIANERFLRPTGIPTKTIVSSKEKTRSKE